ncbi:MAG TPA: restriction endonuclease subunit S [Ignavibacteriaceae bacterium]|nr:restriction endonuclease subunit S [Ignavibacteriaceae bacterium]
MTNSLPNNWQVKSLGEVAKFINGRAFKPEEWANKGLPIIRIQNLTGFSDVFNYFDGDFEKKYLVKKNDILISWSASLGVYVWDKDEAVLNQHIFKVELGDNIDRVFFYYLIKTKIDEIVSHVHGSTMKHITKDRFDNIKVKLPPLIIQKQIAEILEKADQARQKRKEANKLTDEFLQSVFIEMFGDPVKNPKRWDKNSLKNVCLQITDGVHLKPNYKFEGVPFISVKDITTGVLKFNDTKFISKEDHEILIKRCKPEYLDILYTKVGATYGRAAIVNTKKDFSLYVSVALIKPNHKLINPYFLKEMMNSRYVKHQANTCIKGIGVPDLHLVEIKNFEILLPPLSLQQQFAEIVNKTEALKEKQKQSEQELENLFQSLMQKAFKGELVA